MKHSQSPIWQKKRKKRYKKAIHSKSKYTSAKKAYLQYKQLPQKEKPIEKKPPEKEHSKPPVSPFSFGAFFTKLGRKSKGNKGKSPVRSLFKRHDSDIQLVLFPLILLVILIILSVVNDQIYRTVSKQQPVSYSHITTLHPYPYVEAAAIPKITAKAAIILDRDSQVILYSKNPHLRFSMASTTKIMTSLISLAHYKPNDIITVRRSYVPGSGLHLVTGEQFYFKDIMYGMLLPSANDAAQALADNYPGGSKAFVKKMNEKAQSLHLTYTHYGDPTGLDDDGDYTTVVDLAHLASYAITNPTFVQVTSTKYKTIYDLSYSKEYKLTNLNKLLGIDGVTGIKTGTTEGAGEVLVTSMVRNGHTYIVIVMDSKDRFADTKKLLNYIDANVKYIIPPGPKTSF